MKNSLFESFSKISDNSTDPFGAILEGPKFTFGDATGSSPDEDPEGLGREENGAHSRKVDTGYEDRLAKGVHFDHMPNTFNDLDVTEPEYDPYAVGPESDLEKAGTELLKQNYYDNNGISYEDAPAYNTAMADAVPLEGDVLDNGEDAPTIVPDSVEEPGNPLEDEHEIDSETVLGADEEPEVEEPLATPDKDIIALHNISTDELLKELQHRLANKE